MDFLNAQVIQYALMVNLTIYVSCIKQFWATVLIKKVNNVVKLRALIDGKMVVVSEDVIQHDLLLDDADGVECLPNEEIFTELARLGYEKPPPKLTFYKAFFFAQWKFLIHTLVQCISAKRMAWNEFSYSMASAIICLAIVTQLEQDKVAQALEIFKLKRRVKKLEKKRRSKSSGLKMLRKVGTSQRIESSAKTVFDAQEDASNRGRIKAIDADEEITLVDMKTEAYLGAELQGRKDDVSAATKEASHAEPTVFDDEEVTMTMAQTLIKIKAEKARLFDEQMVKRLHDKDVEQTAAREKQEKDDLEKAKVLQKQCKMGHFKGMTYDKVRPIFEREYNKVQTLFKPNKDVEEPTKKRVAKETLLQESFKKIKAVKVSGFHSTQDTPTHDPKEMSKEDVKYILEIVPVSEFKVEALQVKYPFIDWEMHSEGSR
nr:hypothetical protein [Tanacetum cinerariifolium]